MQYVLILLLSMFLIFPSAEPGECYIDIYEPDDNIWNGTSIVPGINQSHSFHEGDDFDWYVIYDIPPGRWLRIYTYNLYSGADTHITLFDLLGNIIDVSDDIDSEECNRFLNGESQNNDACSSRLIWYTESTRYFIRVQNISAIDECQGYTINFNNTGMNLPLIERFW